MTTEIRLSLDRTADPHVLDRVLAVCRQRQLRIDRLHFESGDAVMQIAVSGDRQRVKRLPLWLERHLHAVVESARCSDQ